MGHLASRRRGARHEAAAPFSRAAAGSKLRVTNRASNCRAPRVPRRSVGRPHARPRATHAPLERAVHAHVRALVDFAPVDLPRAQRHRRAGRHARRRAAAWHCAPPPTCRRTSRTDRSRRRLHCLRQRVRDAERGAESGPRPPAGADFNLPAVQATVSAQQRREDSHVCSSPFLDGWVLTHPGRHAQPPCARHVLPGRAGSGRALA